METSTFATALANKGYKQALLDDPHLCNGLNIHRGSVAHEAVARDLDYPWRPAREALGG